MASVYERANGRWLVAYRMPCPAGTRRADGSPVLIRKNKVVDASGKKDAERQAAIIEAEAMQSKPVKQSEGSLGWFLDCVYLPHQQTTKAVKTAHRDAQLANSVKRLIGEHIPLKSIDDETFDKLVAAARAELWDADHPSKAGQRRNGDRQVHHIWGFLKRSMAYAFKKKFVSFNVKSAMLDAPSVARRGPNVKYASAEETRVLVDGLRNGQGPRNNRNPDLADVVEFCFLTAARKQEALGLPWKHVHLDANPAYVMIVDVCEEAGGIFRLRTGTKTDAKTGHLGRKVYLTPDALTLLQRRHEADLGPNWNEDGLVFPDPRTGRVWRPSAVTSMVRVAAKNLGVTSGLHSRRHGGITHLIEAGVPLEVVSKHAGHADTTMTEAQYGWITEELAKKQIASVTAGLSSTTTPAPVSADLDPEVMKMAMEYSLNTGQPLEQVLAILRGQNASKAAE